MSGFSIRLSNGHILKYVAASGALAYDGKGWWYDQPFRWAGLLQEDLFTVVMKTVTFRPRRGNYRWWKPWDVLRFIPDGTVNSFGLTNEGIDWLIRRVIPRLDSTCRLVPSIFGEPEELAEMTKTLNDWDFAAVEVNASCPNTESDDLLRNAEKVVRGFEAVRKNSRHPVIGKLSVAQDYGWIAEESTGLIEAIAINSVPWQIAFPDRPSPLAHHGGGGVSGKAAQPFTWKMVEELTKATKIPVIGPSVWEYSDIAKLRELGTRAVSFGALFLRYPWRPTDLVIMDKEEIGG